MSRFVRRYGDALLALALAAAMTAELLAWIDDQVVASLAAGLLATLPLAVRRRTPLVSFILVMAGIELITVVQPGFDNDSATFVVTFIVALYSLGRHANGLEAWLGAGGVLFTMLSFAESEGGITQTDPGDVAFLMGFVGAPWAAGLTVRLRRQREAVLREENARLRLEQEERARRAVAEERSRIARELHDVVSHAISVTVLQARGARRTLANDPETAREALDAIERTNTAALDDMRRLLAVLRDTEPEGSDLETDTAPQPSLSHLDSLVNQVRDSGLPVRVSTDGQVREVPPGVDLSAYRIVQEALTNVLKHTDRSSAEVRLGYADDALEVRVTNEGGSPLSDGAGSGHGLIGIRERVAVVGGESVIGPLPNGGFEVHARLPYSLEVS